MKKKEEENKTSNNFYTRKKYDEIKSQTLVMGQIWEFFNINVHKVLTLWANLDQFWCKSDIPGRDKTGSLYTCLTQGCLTGRNNG